MQPGVQGDGHGVIAVRLHVAWQLVLPQVENTSFGLEHVVAVIKIYILI